MSYSNSVQAQRLKKRLSIFVLSLLLFTSFITPVFATQVVVSPTKEELLKAVILRAITTPLRTAENAGKVFYDLNNLDALNEEYPAFTNYVKNTDTFKEISGGVNGALKWNDSVKTYYKSVAHDFLYSLLNRDSTVFDSIPLKTTYLLNTQYELYCPYGSALDMQFDNLGRLLLDNNFAPDGIIKFQIMFGELGADTSAINLNVVGGNRYRIGGWGVFGSWTSVTLNDYTCSTFSVPNLKIYKIINDGLNNPFVFDNFITPNFDKVKTYDDVENLPIEDIYKVFPNELDTQNYIDQQFPVILPPVDDYSGLMGEVRQGFDRVTDLLVYGLHGFVSIPQILFTAVTNVVAGFGDFVPMLTQIFIFLPEPVNQIIITCFGFLGLGVALRTFGRK